jgi:hypothetical protein
MVNIPGTSTRSSIAIQQLVEMRSQLSLLQYQLATGKKTNSYAGLGLDRGMTVGLRSQLSAISSFQNTIKNVGIRIDLATTVLTQIDKNRAAAKSSAIVQGYELVDGKQTSAQKLAYDRLDEILHLLNTQAGDRYLFSGLTTDKKPVSSTQAILYGTGTQAGLVQMIAERKEADMGRDLLGRLVIPGVSGSLVSLFEDAAGSPYGIKLASASSTSPYVIVNGPAGTPPGLSFDLGNSNPPPGTELRVTVRLPDGSTEEIRLKLTDEPPATAFIPAEAASDGVAAGLATAANSREASASIEITDLATIADGATFDITYGGQTYTFEYDDPAVNDGVSPGRIEFGGAQGNANAIGAALAQAIEDELGLPQATWNGGTNTLELSGETLNFIDNFSGAGGSVTIGTDTYTNAQQGDTFTVTVGGQTVTLYKVPTGQEDATNGKFSSPASLAAAINASAVGSTTTTASGKVHASIGSDGEVKIVANPNTNGFTIGGDLQSVLGYSAAPYHTTALPPSDVIPAKATTSGTGAVLASAANFDEASASLEIDGLGTIADGATFELTYGGTTLTFEYDDPAIADGVAAGNVAFGGTLGDADAIGAALAAAVGEAFELSSASWTAGSDTLVLNGKTLDFTSAFSGAAGTGGITISAGTSYTAPQTGETFTIQVGAKTVTLYKVAPGEEDAANGKFSDAASLAAAINQSQVGSTDVSTSNRVHAMLTSGGDVRIVANPNTAGFTIGGDLQAPLGLENDTYYTISLPSDDSFVAATATSKPISPATTASVIGAGLDSSVAAAVATIDLAGAADGNTFTLQYGGKTVTFEFDNNATVTPPNVAVALGGTEAATGANLAAALQAQFPGITAAYDDATNSLSLSGTAPNFTDAFAGMATTVAGGVTPTYTAPVAGDTFTLQVGTTTQTFYKVPAGQENAAAGTFSDLASLVAAINTSPVGTTDSGIVNRVQASVDANGNLKLDATPGTASFTAGGSLRAPLGFSPSTYASETNALKDGTVLIGTTPADTAQAIQAALIAQIKQLVQTDLVAASALAAGDDLFNIDAGLPPRRVDGPPFDTATASRAGTETDTVMWYVGEMAATSARGTATARVDTSISVSYGARANEEGIRWVVQNMAVFAATTYSAKESHDEARYQALMERLNANLEGPNGMQKLSDIQAELAGANVTMNAAKDRHTQANSVTAGLLSEIEGVTEEEVGAKILALQTRLQASFATTSLLAELNLVSYMR